MGKAPGDEVAYQAPAGPVTRSWRSSPHRDPVENPLSDIRGKEIVVANRLHWVSHAYVPSLAARSAAYARLGAPSPRLPGAPVSPVPGIPALCFLLLGYFTTGRNGKRLTEQVELVQLEHSADDAEHLNRVALRYSLQGCLEGLA